MTKTKKQSEATTAILEMAEGMHRLGIMDDKAYTKITLRHLDVDALGLSRPIDAGEIRSMRDRENLSQAALAAYMNTTPGYISQLERGIKRASGPALPLLHMLIRKGISVMA